MKVWVKSVRLSSRLRDSVTWACSRAMRSAIAGGGFTVFGGTPLTRSTGQSRAVTAIEAVLMPSSARIFICFIVFERLSKTDLSSLYRAEQISDVRF